MQTILRAGLVGCGSLSQRGVLPHLSLADAQRKVRLVAVADVTAERARQSAEKFGVPAHFTSIEEMLAETDLDLVLVITPIPFHYDNALAAINAGKHVYVQKAMTTTLTEANALLAARDRMGVKLAAAPGFALFPATIATGSLGRVNVGFSYTWGFGHEYEPLRGGSGALAEIDPAWYYGPGAGPLPDVTVYGFQLATSLLGPVRQVTALANKTAESREWRGRQIPVETPDNNVVLMEFVSGALVTGIGANLYGSRRIPWGALSFYGTEGLLEITAVDGASGYPLVFHVEGRNPYVGEYTLADQPYLTGEHLVIEEPHVYCDIMDLADVIIEGRAPRATGEQARHSAM